MFPHCWERSKGFVRDDAVILVRGKTESGSGTPRVLADAATADIKKAAQKAAREQAKTEKIEQARADRRARVAAIVESIDGQPVSSAAPADGAPSADEDWLPPPEDPREGCIPLEDDEHAVKEAVATAAEPDPEAVEHLPLAAAGSAGKVQPAASPAAGTAPALPDDDPTVPAAVIAGPPAAGAERAPAPAKIEGPRLILLYIRESGDRARDTRRLRILYGLLTSYPGNDHFAFHISEAERTYRLEFPTNTTSWTADLEQKVRHLVGAGCVEVKPLNVQ
jgi:hypothetical protein